MMIVNKNRLSVIYFTSVNDYEYTVLEISNEDNSLVVTINQEQGYRNLQMEIGLANESQSLIECKLDEFEESLLRARSGSWLVWLGRQENWITGESNLHTISGNHFSFESISKQGAMPEVRIYFIGQLLAKLTVNELTRTVDLKIAPNSSDDGIWRFSLDEFEIALLRAKRQVLLLYAAV